MTVEEMICKAAATVAPGVDEGSSPHGSFEVILSTPTADRDGEEVKSSEWTLPLPARIPFDADHGMSVVTTVGSGRPEIDAAGRLVVRGTYASTPLAQQTRALVNEGHVTATSVAFLRKSRTDQKGAKQVERELLAGSFVAHPANTEALVLASKGLAVKLGARNSATDATAIQSIHDTAKGLGAACPGMAKTPPAPAKPPVVPGKAMMAPGPSMTGVTGDPAGGGPDGGSDTAPAALAAVVDAALDQAMTLLATVDPSTLPDVVAQAIVLVTAADAASDDLMAALGVPDPPDDPASSTAVPAAAKAAAAAAQAAATRSRITHLLATKGKPS